MVVFWQPQSIKSIFSILTHCCWCTFHRESGLCSCLWVLKHSLVPDKLLQGDKWCLSGTRDVSIPYFPFSWHLACFHLSHRVGAQLIFKTNFPFLARNLSFSPHKWWKVGRRDCKPIFCVQQKISTKLWWSSSHFMENSHELGNIYNSCTHLDTYLLQLGFDTVWKIWIKLSPFIHTKLHSGD